MQKSSQAAALDFILCHKKSEALYGSLGFFLRRKRQAIGLSYNKLLSVLDVEALCEALHPLAVEGLYIVNGKKTIYSKNQ